MQQRLWIVGIALAIAVFLAATWLGLQSSLSAGSAALAASVATVFFFSGGLRKVPSGHRGLLFTLGRRDQKASNEFEEGLSWIIPAFHRLKYFNVLEQSDSINNFSVETGSRLIRYFTLAVQWSYIEGELFHASKIENVEKIISDQLLSALGDFMAYVTDPEDLNAGALRTALKKYLTESMKQASEGFDVSAKGRNWKDLAAVKSKGTGKAWGVSIHNVRVVKASSSTGVQEATDRGLAATIAAGALPATGAAASDYIRAITKAGGDAELAQRSANQQILPDARPIPPSPPNILITSDSSPKDVAAKLRKFQSSDGLIEGGNSSESAGESPERPT